MPVKRGNPKEEQMKTRNGAVKGFVAGVLLCALAAVAATAGANSRIRSAQFNATPVFFEGKALDLSQNPLISVVKEDDAFMSNYMPQRAVLEQMGYVVEWDEAARHITVTSKPAGPTERGRREKLLADLGIDAESRLYKSFADNIDFLAAQYGNDRAALALIVANDCHTHQRGGDAIFRELWEMIYDR